MEVQVGKEKQVTAPQNLPSLGFPYYSFQGVLVLAAPKGLAVMHWSYPGSISIAQIQKNYSGTFLGPLEEKLLVDPIPYP